MVAFEEIEAPKKLLVCHGDYVGQEMFIFESLEMRVELLRWYDHWLKGIDTGIMDEPPVKLFVRNSDEGYRTEKEWPLARTRYTSFYLQPGKTGAAAFPEQRRSLTQAPTTEESYFEFEYPNKDWMSWRAGGVATRVNGMLHPTGGIMTFTSDPLEEDLEVTGPDPIFTLCLVKRERCRFLHQGRRSGARRRAVERLPAEGEDAYLGMA